MEGQGFGQERIIVTVPLAELAQASTWPPTSDSGPTRSPRSSGSPPGNAKVILHRARNRLRAALAA